MKTATLYQFKKIWKLTSINYFMLKLIQCFLIKDWFFSWPLWTLNSEVTSSRFVFIRIHSLNWMIRKDLLYSVFSLMCPNVFNSNDFLVRLVIGLFWTITFPFLATASQRNISPKALLNQRIDFSMITFASGQVNKQTRIVSNYKSISLLNHLKIQ